jgi:hypothetical protein
MDDSYYGHDADELVRQVAVVRDTGATNMLDRNGVRRVADEVGGMEELVEFVDECDAGEYMEVLETMGDRAPLRGGG